MPANRSDNLLSSLLITVSNFSIRHPWKVLVLTTLYTVFSLYYIVNNLGVNTDTSAMLSPDLPYQVNLRKLINAFPQDQDTIVTLIQGKTPEQAKLITKQLYAAIVDQPALFVFPYSPGNSPFFQQNGLLFLAHDELEDLSTNLAKAQPFLGKLARNYSLDGLFPSLEQALQTQAGGQDLPMDLTLLLKKVSHALTLASEEHSDPVSWQTMILGNNSALNQNEQLVIAKPIQDFNALHPAGQSMDFLRAQRQVLEKQYPGSTIQITGSVALDHEELETALSGAVTSALMALTLITLCLYFGLRCYKMVIATFIILITGLIWTTGFAAAAIGHLNIISLAFAVLYIGLGVDYAIHYCLRYQETTNRNIDPKIIQQTTNKISSSLLLCAITTSIGFFAFTATDFLGVSELGLIAGAGIFIGLFVTLTVLPALLLVFRIETHQTRSKLPDWIVEFPIKQHRIIVAVSLLAAIFSLIVISKLEFDPDPINLKAPGSGSVVAFKQLQLSDYFSPLTITVLTDSDLKAQSIVEQLKQLNVVKDAITVFDFVPENIEMKLDIIDSLSLLIGTDIHRLTQRPEHISTTTSIVSFKSAVDHLVQNGQSSIDSSILTNLQSSLNHFLSSFNASNNPQQTLTILQNNLLGYLPLTMQQIEHGLNAESITLNSIPQTLKDRWLSPERTYRIEVLPSKALTNQTNLENFVRAIQSVAPDATGFPVVCIESTTAIVEAFIQAFLSAFIVITLILLISLRSLKAALLVIWPLALGGLLTCATTVIFNTPFNYVNVIALPLLLGIGVDNGIHITQRFRATTGSQNPLRTSTTPAIFYSNLTTVLSFFSLTLTSHAGMASMGWLLAIGVFYAVICTLVILPAYQVSAAH